MENNFDKDTRTNDNVNTAEIPSVPAQQPAQDNGGWQTYQNSQPNYPNGGYQNNAYQNNVYQNNGYQNNPYQNNGYPGGYYNGNMQPQQPQGSAGLGVASLVLGIIAFVLWCVFPVSIPCGIIGFILGFVGLFMRRGKGMAAAGLILSMLAVGLFVASVTFAEDALGYFAQELVEDLFYDMF